MINHCLSDYRKITNTLLTWQQRKRKHGWFKFSSVLGNETRPLAVTQREIRKLCRWLIRSWDSAQQINQPATGSIRQVSWKQWEALLILKKSKRNFFQWHGLLANLPAESPYWKRNREAGKKSANTPHRVKNNSLIFLTVIPGDNSPSKLLIKHST